MDEAIVIQWLQRNWPIWLAFMLALIPPLIAELMGRPNTMAVRCQNLSSLFDHLGLPALPRNAWR